MKKIIYFLLGALAFFVLNYAYYHWSSLKRIIVFKSPTPYQIYLSKLKEAGLENHLLTDTWIRSGQMAMNDSLFITIPYQEKGIFNPAEPVALSYRISVQEGSVLQVDLNQLGKDRFSIFMDLYQVEDSTMQHLISAPGDSTGFSMLVKENSQLLLRIQPELLAQGYYHLKVKALPSIDFPVSGKDYKAIHSIFGDPRDGGRRRHEGIDIFAPRGTPVVAAINGTISRVQNTRLGGKVVWLRNRELRKQLYYAHLEAQWVTPGERVEKGDTLGLVGNSGNAITTPPHLHFGIYQFGKGARDPYPYVYQEPLPVLQNTIPDENVHQWYQASSVRSHVRSGPGKSASVITRIEAGTPLKILGISDKWVKIELPDLLKGYIFHKLIQPLKTHTTRVSIPEKLVYKLPDQQSDPVHLLAPNTSYYLLADFRDFQLIQWTENSELGWIGTKNQIR
ncbi:MAG: peptidoglycan DD-metalloendopeptidase family protein [Candidatus Cyclobacteriaceae bacterium M3_2C_046]